MVRVDEHRHILHLRESVHSGCSRKVASDVEVDLERVFVRDCTRKFRDCCEIDNCFHFDLVLKLTISKGLNHIL